MTQEFGDMRVGMRISPTTPAGGSLADLLRPPPWHADAACRDFGACWDTDLEGESLKGHKPDTTIHAKICATCPVWEMCAQSVLDNPSAHAGTVCAGQYISGRKSAAGVASIAAELNRRLSGAA